MFLPLSLLLYFLIPSVQGTGPVKYNVSLSLPLEYLFFLILFIWENVLTDYSSGLAISLATDLQKALKSFPDYIAERLGQPTKVIDCEKRKRTYSVHVSGGG